METAEIEPVGAHCRNPVGLADAVDEDDQRVLAYAQASGDLDGERAVAAFVRREHVAVEIDRARVVDRTEMDERAARLLLGRGEASAVPERGLVVVQLGDLGVPVAGHLQIERPVEVVFDAFGRMLGLAIAEPTVSGGAEEAEPAHVVGVGDGLPRAVERGGLPRCPAAQDVAQ